MLAWWTHGLRASAVPDWLSEFRAFGPLHLASLVVWLGLLVAVVRLGWRWRDRPRERLLRRAIGVSILVTQSLAEVWWKLPANFDPRESFPLHVCDLAVWAACVAMLTDWRWPRTVVYFMGLGLSTQAFLTPIVQVGPAQVRYWLFWIGHTQIVGTAVYLLVVCRYRPGLRDYLLAVGLTAAYVALILPVDLLMGWNYGYVGPSVPDAPTLLDRLGPWPGRVVLMALMVWAVFTVMWLVPAWLEQRRSGATTEQARG